MIDPNSSNFLTAIASVFLALVGLVQLSVLYAQKKQTRIALTEQYRQLWDSLKNHWGNIVFIGREIGEYYQVLDAEAIHALLNKTQNQQKPTIWALESIQKVCGILGEVSTRVLQGHLAVSDIYPIFGTQFLRQSRPLRQILDPEYPQSYYSDKTNEQHKLIRSEVQGWLLYHDGLRRRCLILIDLLWAEAARLEDLPPYDMKSAADAKQQTGKLNRTRVRQEVIRLNGILKIFHSFTLSGLLRKAEYRSWKNWKGINPKKLDKLDDTWTKRILGERF